MNTWKTNLLMMAGNLAICLIALTTWQALADQNPRTDDVPRLIPYNGVMEFDGQPVTLVGIDAPWIQFDIYDGPDINTSPIYRQRMQVEVRGGRFSALIGPSGEGNVLLEEIIAFADDLNMTITLLNDPDNDADDIALSNPQRLLVSPFAMWSKNASNFDVANDLEVGNDLSVARDISASRNIRATNNVSVDNDLVVLRDADIARNLDVGNSVTADAMTSNRLTLNGTGEATLATAGALLLGPTNNANLTFDRDEIQARNNGNANTLGLQLEGGNTTIGHSNGNANIALRGTVAVNGSLSTTGDLTTSDLRPAKFLPTYSIWGADVGDGGAAIVNDNGIYDTLMIVGNNNAGGDRKVRIFDDLQADANTLSSCSWTAWELADVNCDGSESCSTTDDPDSPGGNYNALVCPSNKIMTGIDFTHSNGDSSISQRWYSIRCCEL